MPSIPSMPNNILSTNMKIAINKYDNLSAYAHKDGDFTYSNAEFDLHIGDLSNFMDSGEKYDNLRQLV